MINLLSRQSIKRTYITLNRIFQAMTAEGLASTVQLNDGVCIPLFGLGTYKASDSGIVTCAIQQGYKLIDTAQFYGNEKEVGIGVRNSGTPRDQVFVVSKVSWDCHGSQECAKAVEESLKKLDIGYVDLFLIHTPAGGKILETYDTLLKFKERGLIRSVGVSNFGIHHLEGLKQNGRPLPSVNQIELQVHFNQQKIVDYCLKNNITVMGYSPLAKWKAADDKIMIQMAQRYGKTLAQLMIRWSVQKGYITIPKTTHLERLAENAAVFDWSISEEDMTMIASLPQASCTWEPVKLEWLP